jgi:NAD(P)-dependent dehydrogenase (short-subunit alcohol dehydrogenase family)
MPARVFAITGGFGFLGSAVAAAAVAQGAKVALIDYAPTSAAPQLAGEVLPLGGVDLTDPASAERAFAAAAERFGGIDALLNIAGGFAWETVEAGSPQRWQDLYRINVLTTLNASRAALPHLRRSTAGRIVNVGANAALRAMTGMGAYAASKSGVHALTQALSEELKAEGVTVNAVLPSIIDTPVNRADMPDADQAAWVKPAELAAVMLFLASEGASAVTGALVPVIAKV